MCTSNLHCEICRRPVLLAKKEIMQQGTADRLIEIAIFYGMEMDVGKTKLMRM